MTKIALMSVVVLILAVPIAGRLMLAAAQNDELAAVPRISQAEFKKALQSGRILVLDVRDAASYSNGHIPGAQSMPLDELPRHLGDLKAETRPIVTYCA